MYVCVCVCVSERVVSGFNVNVALITPPPPPKLVLVPGVWRGRKKRVGANNADSGGLGGG